MNPYIILIQSVATSVTPTEQSVELCLLTAGMDAFLPLLQISWLLKGNAEGLGAHRRGALLHHDGSLAVLPDRVLARLGAAEWGHDEVALVEGGDEALPIVGHRHLIFFCSRTY